MNAIRDLASIVLEVAAYLWIVCAPLAAWVVAFRRGYARGMRRARYVARLGSNLEASQR